MPSSAKYPKNRNEPNLEGNMKSLQVEDITKWSPSETLFWLLNNINCRAEELAVIPLDKVAGKRALDVLRITREDFTRLIPGCGEHIYDLFQSKFQTEGYESYDTILDGLELDRENAKSKKDKSRNFDVDPKFLYDIFLELKNNFPTIKVEEIAAMNLEIMKKFNYHDLKRLSLEELQKLLPTCASSVYCIMQKKFSQQNYKEKSYQHMNNYPFEQHTNASEDDCNSYAGVYSTKPTVPEKRKRGRPQGSTKRNKPERRVGHVWEFLLKLLLSPGWSHVVSWQNRATGVFQFNDTKQFAQLWGKHRGNPKMTFGKFSRSIRHNYKKGYLLPVPKRLVYKFGPKTKGWQLKQE